MLIGILSDTHDRIEAARAAIDMLRFHKVQFYIHCGDVGTERILDLLAGLPVAFVWGNNDWDRKSLDRYARKLNLAGYGDEADLELDGKRIAVIHGDDAARRQRILHEQRHDYLLQGHTHVPLEGRVGKIHLINPGALHRASIKTVALLDTKTDLVRLLTLDLPSR